MDSLEQQKSGQDAKVSAGADDLHRIIGELHRRASHHRWVGVITVASAAIVILAGLIPVVALIQNPFINIPKTADLSVLITNSSVRLFALAIIGYMVHLLTSIYRYNTQLWNHYSTRAWALELAAGGTIPLTSAVSALSASTVTFEADGPLPSAVSISTK
jgi:uncharacterized membrane protein